MKIFFQNIGTYDLEGNILSLTRHGIEETQPGGGHAFEVVNQLAVVPRGVESNETRSEVVSNDADLWASYGSQNYLPNGDFEDNLYDFNGNLLFDDMRETEFKYNYLNLATKITNPSDTMLIQYDALGNKVRQISGGDTMYFVGGSIYKNSQLYYLPLPEGYYRDGSYHSVIRDYLGSVRVVTTLHNVTPYYTIDEVNHYGPFGVEYGLSDEPFGVQPFKHQGKERMNITGFSLHNHGARLADNVMGRWTTRDPLEEKDYWNGAYTYCGNNPVKYIDPDGRANMSFDKHGKDDDKRKIFKEPETEVRDLHHDYVPHYIGNNNNTPPPDDEPSSTQSATIAPALELPLWLTIVGVFEKVAEAVGPVLAVPAVAAVAPLIFLTGDTRRETFENVDAIGSNNSVQQYREHDSNKSKSKAQKHTAPRSGGDPENGRYGKQRNDNRGSKNQKHIPQPNPNKRK